EDEVHLPAGDAGGGGVVAELLRRRGGSLGRDGVGHGGPFSRGSAARWARPLNQCGLRRWCRGIQDAVGGGVAVDLAVEGVALDGGLAGLADQATDIVEVELLVGRAGVSFALGDVVPDDGAVEVVAAVVE